MMIVNITIISLVFFYAGYRFGQHVIVKGLTHQINDMLNSYSPEERKLVRNALEKRVKNHK